MPHPGYKDGRACLHFQLEAPVPVACEECGVEGEFVRFGKRDVAYRDLPINMDLPEAEKNYGVDLST
ncbi:MAG TPA: hypothetical protein DD989_13900, partial [Pseudomonas sp.]|nr:hypothetical protein [Pseudomonas sp.]